MPDRVGQGRRVRTYPAGNRYAERGRPAGFSLVEVLVVIAIISILLALLMPAMSSCRRAAQNLKCASQLRSVTIEFRFFADDFAARRGESEAFGEKLFKLEDFLDSMYRTDEFWDQPTLTPVEYTAGREVMMCPASAGTLSRRPLVPCDSGGVSPRANVSVALNMRLARATDLIDDQPVFKPKLVASNILDHPAIPLALDVDGRAADLAGQSALMTAPPVDSPDHYKSGDFWFPAYRHAGRVNVALIDGSVHGTANPLAESGWDWAYQPK
ncbi:MAG: type II secretion system protein [Phycisphaerae bacterium]